MQEEIEQDLAELEGIIGELNYEEMSVLKSSSPGVFVLLITKVFAFLAFLAKIPIRDEDGNPATMNLYRKALDTLIAKNTHPNGDKPSWLEKVEMIYDWGCMIVPLIDSIG